MLFYSLKGIVDYKMSSSYSPLRYPGGKTAIFDIVSQFIRTNKLQRRHYAEPYAGGAGLALKLLFNGFVSDIHLNDIDRGIWAFWDIVLNQNQKFVDKINATPITMEEWYKQKNVIEFPENHEDFMLGFATFFLNRTNRSGIIKNAGVIGGKKQNGNYKLDCRFNKDDLTNRITRIAKYKNRIHLTNQDALDFMNVSEKTLPKETFFCIDPPYFNKGSSLYTNFYEKGDHSQIADAILELKRPWILTYDNVAEIKDLYMARRQFEFNLKYSANIKRVGTELLIASEDLHIPQSFKVNQSHQPQYWVA